MNIKEIMYKNQNIADVLNDCYLSHKKLASVLLFLKWYTLACPYHFRQL